MLTTLWTVVEVEFLPVYIPNDAEKKDAALYAENVRKYMATRCGKAMSELGFEDCRLVQAGTVNLPSCDSQ